MTSRLDRPLRNLYNSDLFAEVVELVDTSVSKTDAFGRAGSIPAFGTIQEKGREYSRPLHLFCPVFKQVLCSKHSNGFLDNDAETS